MSTLKEALEALNSQFHDYGYHITKVNMDLVPEGTDEEENTMHDLMKQTYDWRYAGKIKGHELPSDDTVFHVDLSAANMRYIGAALEVFNQIHFEIHIKPVLERMIVKMGAVSDGEK